MIASFGLHCRVDVFEDQKRLSSHSNVTLGDDLIYTSLTSMISPYYSKTLKRVSFSSSMGTFSFKLLIYIVLFGALSCCGQSPTCSERNPPLLLPRRLRSMMILKEELVIMLIIYFRFRFLYILTSIKYNCNLLNLKMSLRIYLMLLNN